MRSTLQRRACISFVCVTAMFAGCGYLDTEPQPGIYRAIIKTPVGELPFGLQLEESDGPDSVTGFILNGADRIQLKGVSRAEKRFVMALPRGENTLTFTARRKKLNGTLRLFNDGSAHDFPFQAELGTGYRFFAESMTDNADVAGRWSVTIAQSSGSKSFVADLMQSHDQVAAVFYEHAGQQRLTGQVQDDEFRLSSFDGSTALLLTATVNGAGDLEGEFWSSLAGSARWTAKRDPEAELETESTEAAL